MITLRDYQISAVNDIKTALVESERKSVVCEMPTGGGKTVVFSYIALEAIKKGSSVLVLTDREELLKETGSTFEDFGIKPQLIRSGIKRAPEVRKGSVFIGMAQTLKRKIKEHKWVDWFSNISLVIIDECHKQEFNKFFEKNVFLKSVVVGFSATPKRSGKQRQLGEDYDHIVHTVTTKWLVNNGYLTPEVHYAFDAPDMTGVAKKSDGDYSESAMFKKYNTAKTYSGAIKAYQSNTNGTIAVVFCSNIIHAARTAKEFCKAGISAKFLSSKMSKPKRPDDNAPDAKWVKYYEDKLLFDEYCDSYLEYSGSREQVIEQWKSGEVKVVCNAGILTTGFNFPAIETVILLRATLSEILYLQMIGRGSRLSELTFKTHFNILDFGGNGKRLGGYRIERRWNLYHEGRSSGGTPPIKECGLINELPVKDKNGKNGCGYFIFASARICPECGYIYPEKKEEKEVELSLVDFSADGSFAINKPISRMSYRELDEYSKTRKFKKGWVAIQLYIRGGYNELVQYAKHKNYQTGWATIAKSQIPKHIIQEHDNNNF